MKVVKKWIVPGTKERYELHIVAYDKKRDWELWSNVSQKYLKDTTSYGRYRGIMRTYGLTFESEMDTIQRKMYLKDIIKLCKIENNGECN